MTKRLGPTPEALASKAIRDYLAVARIGKVKRVNVGQARIGQAPTHPWQKDTRRIVRFGEVGHSDLQVELRMDDPRIPAVYRGRDLFPEVKAAGWTPPPVPKFGAAASTLKRYRHHLDQVAFLTRQNERGNLGFFVRTPTELYQRLLKAGFVGLPVPEEATQEPRKAPARTVAKRPTRTGTPGGENGSQK